MKLNGALFALWVSFQSTHAAHGPGVRGGAVGKQKIAVTGPGRSALVCAKGPTNCAGRSCSKFSNGVLFCCRDAKGAMKEGNHFDDNDNNRPGCNDNYSGFDDNDNNRPDCNDNYPPKPRPRCNDNYSGFDDNDNNRPGCNDNYSGFDDNDNDNDHWGPHPGPRPGCNDNYSGFDDNDNNGPGCNDNDWRTGSDPGTTDKDFNFIPWEEDGEYDICPLTVIWKEDGAFDCSCGDGSHEVEE